MVDILSESFKAEAVGNEAENEKNQGSAEYHNVNQRVNSKRSSAFYIDAAVCNKKRECSVKKSQESDELLKRVEMAV